MEAFIDVLFWVSAFSIFGLLLEDRDRFRAMLAYAFAFGHASMAVAYRIL